VDVAASRELEQEVRFDGAHGLAGESLIGVGQSL
jgi:hypothetical protein